MGAPKKMRLGAADPTERVQGGRERQNHHNDHRGGGPSAAGKTTWCLQTGTLFVPDYQPTGEPQLKH